MCASPHGAFVPLRKGPSSLGKIRYSPRGWLSPRVGAGSLPPWPACPCQCSAVCGCSGLRPLSSVFWDPRQSWQRLWSSMSAPALPPCRRPTPAHPHRPAGPRPCGTRGWPSRLPGVSCGQRPPRPAAAAPRGPRSSYFPEIRGWVQHVWGLFPAHKCQQSP